MTPINVYRRLNKQLWFNRLPPATIVFVDDATIPSCYGLTLDDDVVRKPVIFLNKSIHSWHKTLIHEMIHIAEPRLRHGKLFSALVETYCYLARPYLTRTAKKP